MRESGLIENMLQDLLRHREELTALGLLDVADQLKNKNAEVRQLIATRNEERMEQVAGELKAARQASDEAYAVVVFYTNAYYAMNPDRREARDLVCRMQEDLEYFRQHAMTNSNRSRNSREEGDEEPKDGE